MGSLTHGNVTITRLTLDSIIACSADSCSDMAFLRQDRLQTTHLLQSGHLYVIVSAVLSSSTNYFILAICMIAL